MIPLSIYIHLPWCVQKCPYCDFNSHALKTTLPEADYLAALFDDFASQEEKIHNRKLTSIFFGGGTPSLFSGKAIEKILTKIAENFSINDIEITLEANPGTLDEKKFSDYFAAGVNRLSIGIQSFNERHLKQLGRIHNSNDASRAIHIGKKVGFENINIDLMYGLGEQTLNEALEDIEKALQHDTTHLSWYQLTLEPNTFFYHHPPKLPHDDVLFAMQKEGQALIGNHFSQYEVSAYSKPNLQCRHNLNYWEFGDYLGLGAGAHSKITNLENHTIMRFMQSKHPKDYLNQAKRRDINYQIIDEKNRIFEFMLNALRLTNGVKNELFVERTGIAIEKIQPLIDKGRAKQLLTSEDGFLKPTPLGKLFLNDLVELFLP